MLWKQFIIHRFYHGCCPKLVISDIELAKEIMVKEFDQFTDRGFIVSGNYYVEFEQLLIALSWAIIIIVAACHKL